ncbi:SPRY domain-containing SOCS box protein 3 [Thelohanellus kitauei]|uniref:SPRY domain-containing SOCS box protein 3 n=1 Tax=Thelohanellus kitauei TaxID=669202 RepID=A0A0C2MGG9_THEKT|nr:SPRY domain-containing SOCS box protein 3 [Thelohanellus kitauei]
MKFNTPIRLYSNLNKSINQLNIAGQPSSHWVALKLLNITHIESFTWKWKKKNNMDAKFEDKDTMVVFHPEFSSGTEMVLGDTQFVKGNIYFWEIELLTPVYGTDMMVGIATSDINTNQYQYMFRGPLGENENSWGISYHGYTQHEGIRTKLMRLFHPSRFGDGTKFGFHLDTWQGYVEIYINGNFTGTIWRSEKFVTHITKPIISSTAARTRMRLLYSTESQTSLKFLALRSISKQYSMRELLEIVKKRNVSSTIFLDYFWLFH